MENASKALIIAGAILISILLISVGIIIMNAVNNPVDSAATAADEYVVKQFNAKFSKLEGKQTGSALSDLSSDVKVSNAKDTQHQVTLTLPGGITSSANLVKTKKYNVSFTYSTDGYISAIVVN